MIAKPIRGKGRVFLILGLAALTISTIALTKFHLDFVSGFATAFGIGAIAIAFRWREPYAT